MPNNLKTTEETSMTGCNARVNKSCQTIAILKKKLNTITATLKGHKTKGPIEKWLKINEGSKHTRMVTPVQFCIFLTPVFYVHDYSAFRLRQSFSVPKI